MRDPGFTPKHAKLIGAMVDPIQPQQTAAATVHMRALLANILGATETGVPPASARLLACDEPPSCFPKTLSVLCEVRLVDADDRGVDAGEPGELLIGGPTLISGRWYGLDATARDSRGGRLRTHIGNSLRRYR